MTTQARLGDPHESERPQEAAAQAPCQPVPQSESPEAPLLPLVYEQLRASAQQMLASERPGQTLQATALVHEAYLKLMGPRRVPWSSRAHFYAAAATAMRQILIDHARSRAGRATALEARRRALALPGIGPDAREIDPDGLLALDEALIRLERADPQAASVVRLRFFAGLDVEQTAETLCISPRTVKRDWAFARGWLREALEGAAPT